MSGRLMGGLTPMIWALLVEGLGRTVTIDGQSVYQVWLHPLLPGWRWSFWFFGSVGVVWCGLFALWFRNRPAEKASVNAAELALIHSGVAATEAAHRGVPWGRLVRSGNLWALCLMYFCQAYGWYFYITYLPKFLETQFGVAKTDPVGAIYKGGPLWLGALGCLAGGFLTDRFIRRTGNRRLGRKLFGLISHAAAAVCFLLAPCAPTAFWFFVAMAAAGFVTDLAMGPAWAACQDIGRRYAAIVAGSMNMIGNLGGTVASWMSGYVLQLALASHASGLGVRVEELSQIERTAGLLRGYHINFYLFAAVYVVGVLCWTRVDATQPIVPDEVESHGDAAV
jgi:nitrate/nitrite transporter NarK